MRSCTLRPHLLVAVAVAGALLTARASHAVSLFAGATLTTLTSTDGPVPIPDNGQVVALLDFAGSGTVVDVDVAVDILHTNAQDLDIFLVSPAGTTVTLTTDNGGANDNVFAGTVFDDQAPGAPSAPNVRNFTYTNLVATGSIQPEEPLGAVIGEPAAGPWALVVIDDQGGNTGTLRSWSLTIATFGKLAPSAPVTFAGQGGMTISKPEGVSSTATVSGVGAKLYDVNVSIDVSHTNCDDLDIFLTSPSGRRIDLVTDIGGANDDLYEGTVFDDQSGNPIGDLTPLPASGTAVPLVAGEGALSAFVGEDPNGTWTLTVVDDTATYNGKLNGWSLAIVTATACGDGTLDPGEVCDDGNVIDGDGCDSNCTPSACGNGVVAPNEDCDDGNTVGGDGCPSTCQLGETSCDDCVDNDGNGLIDSADPACEPAPLNLRSASISSSGGKVRIAAKATLAGAPSGPVTLSASDGNGAVFCASVGSLKGSTKAFSAKGASVSLRAHGKRGVSIKLQGKGLDLSMLNDPNVTIGLTLGGQHFAASGPFRPRGGRWVYP
jgi:cysteine-rich repeat protein